MSSYLLPQIVYTRDLHTYIVPAFLNNDATVNDATVNDATDATVNDATVATDATVNNITNKIIINKTLHKYLNALKAQIDEQESAWDKFKKYTNPYEFIHTIVPNTRQSICTHKPLSRSFFKMIEMTHMLNILPTLPADACKSFHLAEGPGGFIEAISFLRKNTKDLYYGMTLLEDSNVNVPGWRKSKEFLLSNTNVIIEKGIDGKGDLMNPRNLIHCFKNYRGQFDLVTGDGGFDFSIHYLSQEIVSAPLILCQISFAVAMQKRGGAFIIKMFDTFSKISLDILYLLSNIYETVNFVKPHTSRYANSEKYIVCKNFRLDEKLRQEIINALYKVIVQLNLTSGGELYSLFNFELPYYFVNKVEEYNAILGQQQIENINTTLSLIDNSKYDKLELIKKNNIQKCISWCQNYQMSYNPTIQTNNIFLANKPRVIIDRV